MVPEVGGSSVHAGCGANTLGAMSAAVHTTRLAPSPTGALHLGNARTFLCTWALARRLGWRIVLRIEDLDGPRVKAGAAEACIDTLTWLGMDWDEGPIVQSRDLSPYVEAMVRLAAAGTVYPSEETRAEIEARAGRGVVAAADDVGDSALSAPQEGTGEVRFDAAWRPRDMPNAFVDRGVNWRFATPAGVVEIDDACAGVVRLEPAASIGDFVVWTKRGQPAYQLAVVVDDARHGVTQVVRGNDLLDSAGRQVLLQRALGMAKPPAYTHLPLVRGADGRRLAKRHGDTRVERYRVAGVRAERVIGLIAEWCGLGPRHEMTAAEFAGGWALDMMPRDDVTFLPEDDAWLCGR